MRWPAADGAGESVERGRVILEAQGLVLTAEDDTIAPGRDLSAIRLTAILDAVRHEVPNSLPAAAVR
jgi:hypothetical protein